MVFDNVRLILYKNLFLVLKLCKKMTNFCSKVVKRNQNHYMCFASILLLICYLKVIMKAGKFGEILVKFHESASQLFGLTKNPPGRYLYYFLFQIIRKPATQIIV